MTQLAVLLLSLTSGTGATGGPPTHHEAPPARMTPGPRSPRELPSAPSRPVERGGYISVQVNVDADGNNIVGDAANEPSLAIDPTDSSRGVIGWRQFDTVLSSFREAGYAWTADGGGTWVFPGTLEEGVFRSDPVLDVDAEGVFYYSSLLPVGPDLINTVHLSADGGRTFDLGTFAWGGDKQWMAVDRTGGVGHGNVYANWTRLFSSCDGQLTRSYDDGLTYEQCVDVPGEPLWGTIAIDADGAVYIASTAFAVVKSSTLQDSSLPAQFDFVTPVDLGGPIVFGAGPNPGGLLGQAWIDVDISEGPMHGNLYMLASVDPPGGDPLDVMIVRSDDGGMTWSEPVRVNDDAPASNAWQWFGMMAVAPDGRLDVVWYDTRASLQPNVSELYYAYSEDGGRTWSKNLAVTPAFDSWVGWPDQNKLGDYADIVSDARGANVAYAATFNGEQDVYFVHIETPVCPDLDGDDHVTFADLLDVLAAWGPCAGCPEDLDASGVVDFGDIIRILSSWGRCPLTCCLPTDECAPAPTVGDGAVRFSTLLATSGAPDLPGSCDEGRGVRIAKDVWLRYVAPCDGVVTATICESDYDTRLAVYDDTGCPGALRACSDDACGEGGTRSTLTFTAVSGAAYLVRIGGNLQSGRGVLELQCAP